MKVHINDIGAEGIERTWEEAADHVNEVFEREPHNSLRVDSPVRVTARLAKVGADIELSGTVGASLRFQCNRCCEEGRAEIGDRFHYILLPDAVEDRSEAGDDEDDAGPDEGLELGRYTGDEIDISPYAIEQLLLAVPVKLLCREDCRGICGGCGANLNTERCLCADKGTGSGPFKKILSKES